MFDNDLEAAPWLDESPAVPIAERNRLGERRADVVHFDEWPAWDATTQAPDCLNPPAHSLGWWWP